MGGHQSLGTGFRSHGPHAAGFRTDEDQAGGLDHFREFGVLGKKSVARMDGIAAGIQGGIEHRLLVQITGRCFRWTDGYGLIGHTYMFGMAVCLRINGYGGDAQLPAGPHDPARDFATVGNEDFFKQAHSPSQ